MKTRASTHPCSEGLRHLLHTTEYHNISSYGFKDGARSATGKTATVTTDTAYHLPPPPPPSPSGVTEIPLHLVAEHANELLHPSRDGLRHPLGEVGTLGADDQLLVGAVFVHIVDRAAQNLRATEIKKK